MKTRHPPNAFTPAIRTTQLAQGLIRLYQRLAGELEKHRAGETSLLSAEEAASGMGHIRALLTMLGVHFESRRIRPRKTRIQIGPLDYGGMKRGILKTLKSRGDWMTYTEVVDTLIREHRLNLTVSQRRHFQQKIREAAHALKKAGLIEPQLDLGPGRDPQEQRWRLSVAIRLPRQHSFARDGEVSRDPS
jgi:hypothetical protein